MYTAQPMSQAQPLYYPSTMPFIAPPYLPFQQQIPEQLLNQFHQFDDRMYARSCQNFERIVLSHVMAPQNVQPINSMPGHSQPGSQHINPFPQSNPPTHPQFMATPTHHPVTGTYSQESQPVRPRTSFYSEHDVSTPSPSHTGLEAEPSMEIPLKRKDAMPDLEATGSKKSKHIAAFKVESEDIALITEPEVQCYKKPASPSNSPKLVFASNSIPAGDCRPELLPKSNLVPTPLSTLHSPSTATVSPSATLQDCSDSVKSNTSTPTSSISTVRSNSTRRFEKQSISTTSLSLEKLNMMSLKDTVDLAKSKLDGPIWKCGVPLDENVIVTKDHFADFIPPEWYSLQTMLAWRACMTIPLNFIVLVHNEDIRRYPLSKKTTDVIRINLELERKHWTLIHLSIEQWAITYYDSYLGLGHRQEDHFNMTHNCTLLITDLRDAHTVLGIELPDRVPKISAEVSQTHNVFKRDLIHCHQCTIRQTDYYSCGPFALREAENLMGFDVENDQECPLAIRCRHAQTIFKAICKHINSASELESNPQVVTATSIDFSEIPMLQIKNDRQQDNSLVHDKSLPQSIPDDSPAFLLDESILDISVEPPALADEVIPEPTENTSNEDVRDFDQQIERVIHKGIACWEAEVNKNHIFSLNGRDVDHTVLSHFTMNESYDNDAMALLFMTCGLKDGWALVLHDVETRKLPRSIKNIIYMVDRQHWLMIHVNLHVDSLTLYSSSASDVTSAQAFVEEVQRLHRRRNHTPMAVNKTQFSTEYFPGMVETTCGKGVMAWSQAEVLLGLIEQPSSQSTAQARLRHVSQVVDWICAKLKPCRRLRSAADTAASAPDSSGDSEFSPCLQDTLQNRLPSKSQNGNGQSSIPCSSSRGSKSNTSLIDTTKEIKVYRRSETRDLIVVGPANEAPLLLCSQCTRFQYPHQFSDGHLTCKRCSCRRKGIPAGGTDQESVCLLPSEVTVTDKAGGRLQFCSSCHYYKEPGGFAKGSRRCDVCSNRMTERINDLIDEGKRLGKQLCRYEMQLREPHEFVDNTSYHCKECAAKRRKQPGRSRNSRDQSPLLTKRICHRCGENKDIEDFAYCATGACTYCTYGGPPPSKVDRFHILEVRYEGMKITLLRAFSEQRFLPSTDVAREDLQRNLALYNENLRTAEKEKELFMPTRITAVDLLIVIYRTSSGMTKRDRERSDELISQSFKHLTDKYLSGRHPKQVHNINLSQSAIDEAPFKRIYRQLEREHQSLNTLPPGSSVVFLLHGRDGLSVRQNEWVHYEEAHCHITTTVIISEHIRRIATEVQTGWVEAVPHTPERVWCFFDTKRLVEVIKGNQSDMVYQRLLDKWSFQLQRRLLIQESGAAEGGLAAGRNRLGPVKGEFRRIWEPTVRESS